MNTDYVCETLVAQVDESDRQDVHTAIISAFCEYTRKFMPEYNPKPFKIYIENKDNQIIAGLNGTLFANYDCIVSLVSVDMRYHGQGLGTMLFNKLESYARANNCTNIRLETSEKYAKPFYEKLGFVKIAEFPDGYLGLHSYVLRKYLNK